MRWAIRKWGSMVSVLIRNGSSISAAAIVVGHGLAVWLLAETGQITPAPHAGTADRGESDKGLVAGDANPADISIVSEPDSQGRRRVATIVIPPEAPAQRRESAELLRQYVRDGTGVELVISSRASEHGAIHVGRSAYVDSLGLRLDTLDADGFVLKGIDDRTFVIAGPTEYGTEFGVDEFLERFVGVRWLFPGRRGTDVPRRSSVRAPSTEVRMEPSFRSRMVSGFRTAEESEWARRLRLHGRISFHHNLHKLFPASRYARSHPEFFPSVDGRRYLPKDDADQTCQPNFSAEGLAAEAIRNIAGHFRAHPDDDSYSLGINDGVLVDQSIGRGRNYLGFGNISEPYFRWCNEVVAGVLEQFPDKWFGCLAYQLVAEPPTFVKIHPRLVPFMTYDRAQWADPERRRFSEDLTRKWAEAGGTLGWYDYLYGAYYCLPRCYPHLMGEYLRFGHAQGVRMHYAEGYPNWGEGPKLYVHMKLLWDHSTDVDATLDEWYSRCVGPEASDDLKRYFAIWERFWTRAVTQSPWFDRGREYLPFSSPTYLRLVEEKDLLESRKALEACRNKAGTREQRVRADLFLNSFEYYELSARGYRASTALQDLSAAADEDVLRAIDEQVDLMATTESRRDLVRRNKGDPFLDVPHGWEEYPQLRGEDWCAGLLWGVLGQVNGSGSVRQRLEQLLHHPLDAVRERAGQVLSVATAEHEGRRVSDDPSFEKHEASPWGLWNAGSAGSLRRAEGIARSGRYSVLCEGVQRGGPHQRVSVQPGRYVALAYAWVPTGQRAEGTVAITATLVAEDDQHFPTHSRETTPVAGVWTPISCPIDVPVGRANVTRVLLNPMVNGWGAGESVYFDDVALYRLSESP